MTELIELNEDFLLDRADTLKAEDEMAKKATAYARYAMADVEFALNILGTTMSKDEYTKVFRAMMVRKAKNEVRKYNAHC